MTEREREIEARIKAASAGPQEFSIKDIPYLLAQLRRAEGKLEAVEEAAIEHDYQHARQFMDAIDRILNPQEAE